jgi:hypothetical protein
LAPVPKGDPSGVSLRASKGLREIAARLRGYGRADLASEMDKLEVKLTLAAESMINIGGEIERDVRAAWRSAREAAPGRV